MRYIREQRARQEDIRYVMWHYDKSSMWNLNETNVVIQTYTSIGNVMLQKTNGGYLGSGHQQGYTQSYTWKEDYMENGWKNKGQEDRVYPEKWVLCIVNYWKNKRRLEVVQDTHILNKQWKMYIQTAIG